MAKRVFKLPEIHQLTPSQQKIQRLPLKGQFLVVGAPGTGKSVVALNRLAQYSDCDDVTVLTFNHVLKAYTNQLVSSGVVAPALSWLYSMQYGLTNEYMPEKLVEENGKRLSKSHNPDYEQLNQIFEPHKDYIAARFEHYKNMESGDRIWNQQPPEGAAQNQFNKEAFYAKVLRKTDLIVDEGQDLPAGFYESLMYLGFENFFIVADQNQQIRENNSDRKSLEKVLALDTSEVYELEENHRNTTPIATICRHFYTDRASPPPKLPEKPSIDIPTLINYSMVDKCVEFILREADRDPSKLIGVIVPTEAKRQDYVRKFSNMDIERDNQKPTVSSYSSEEKSGQVFINFSEGGIVVLCDKSVKGIEFDKVYVILDGLKLYDETAMKKRLYVMASRAREKLFFMQSQMYPTEVANLLPQDAKILQRVDY